MGRIVAALAVAGAVAAGLAGCASLDEAQRRIALRPTPGVPPEYAPGTPAEQASFRPGDRRYTVTVPGAAGGSDALALWWLPQADPQAPVLLYLHGTFRNLYGNLSKVQALREAGFSVLAVDYRGWGESAPIIPSEDTITADAATAWAELQRLAPAAPARRVVFGHSLGGAVAVRLASTLKAGRDYGALVLESTFTRLPDVAAAAGFWGRVGAAITTLRFDSKSRIGAIDAPVLILHGSADRTVPVELGRALRDAAPPGTRYVELPQGSHSRLHSEFPELYQQTFKDLIARLPPP
jgi:pimeloyl-ACP methyl ester carboxylesterase